MVTKILRDLVVSVLLVSAICSYYVSADDWRYFGIYGEQNWATIYVDCNAANHTRQSPVDIVRAETIESLNLTEIGLVRNGTVNGQMTMVNNGHTVNLDFNQTAVYISGGNLQGRFRVGGIHFHWGSTDAEGSEHTIDGKHFPIEMHVVTYDETRYTGVLQASPGINSIAVLSVLFKITTDDNSAFSPVVSHLPQVAKAGQPIYVPYFDLQALLPQNRSRYYRYLGSLTTPPCSESVIWSVFDDNNYISSSQLSAFRKLLELPEPDNTTDLLEDNWRLTQPLDGRQIQRSFTSFANGADLSFNKMSQIALIAAALIATMGVMLYRSV